MKTKEKTKKIEYYVDLESGWQDKPDTKPWIMDMCPSWTPPERGRRLKVVVELPMFGGTMDIDDTIGSVTETVKSGYQG